jgi:hypothetical protein
MAFRVLCEGLGLSASAIKIPALSLQKAEGQGRGTLGFSKSAKNNS